MVEASNVNLPEIARRIADGLGKAEKHLSGLKKLNTGLVIISLAGSSLTTLVTGATAMRGPLVGGDGENAWRLACAVGAVLGFLTTFCLGLNQQLQVADRLSKANECIGRLKALDVAIVTGGSSEKEIVTEFENIVRAFPEPLR
jgi:hypothetical protein